MSRQKAARRTLEGGMARNQSIARTAGGGRALNWRAVRSIYSLRSSSERADAGREWRIPAFFKPLGEGSYSSFLVDTPLSQEDFAQLHTHKQPCEIFAVCCYLLP